MDLKTKTCLRLLASALLLTGLNLQAEAPKSDPLEFMLADSAPFWTWDPDTFAREMRPLGFSWTQDNESARAAPLKGKYFGKPADEVVVRFADGTPNNIAIHFFNRGDRTLSQMEFETEVRELIETITRTLREQPRPGTNRSARSSVRDDSRIWQHRRIQFELAYSFTPARSGEPFRAEYIRLTARTFTPDQMPSHAITSVNPYTIRENVHRDPATGDVWIQNIPMVDQGPRGYCAAATAERILRYFGQEVDQHQIAQIANTTSDGGTSTDELKRALNAVGRQYSFSLNTHIEWDFRHFLREVDRYNRESSRRGSPGVNVPSGGTIYINQIYAQLDPETFMATRMSRRAEFNRFRERVQRYVDGGCPLAWGVTLGLFEEPTPTGTGGHLRLITGYNLQENLIYYSDSWGRGHERKSMPMDQAFTITSSLFSMEPRGLRL